MPHPKLTKHNHRHFHSRNCFLSKIPGIFLGQKCKLLRRCISRQFTMNISRWLWHYFAMDFNLPVPFGTSGFSKRILSFKSTRSGSSPSNLISFKLVRTWHRSLTLPPPALCASRCLRGSLRRFRFGSYSLLLHGEWMVNGKWYTILQKPLFVRLHVIKSKGLWEWNSEKPDIVCFTMRENWLLDFQVIVLPLKNEFVIHDERGLFWIASWIQLRWKKTCI